MQGQSSYTRTLHANQLEDRNIDPGLVEHRDGPSGEDWFDWGTAFCDEIYAGLIGVIQDLGTSDRGWGSMRWEVHDKVSELPGYNFSLAIWLTSTIPVVFASTPSAYMELST